MLARQTELRDEPSEYTRKLTQMLSTIHPIMLNPTPSKRDQKKLDLIVAALMIAPSEILPSC